MPRVVKSTRGTKSDDRAKVKSEPKSSILIPTGSTLLNLACSDNAYGGFGSGKVVNIIGDSHAGKTMLALTVCAEMCHDARFDDYLMKYRDVEAALAMDIPGLFGQKTADRLLTSDNDDVPDTVEDFGDEVESLCEKPRPFIYVLDSLDALDTIADKKKSKELRVAREKGTDTSGSYEMSKPKQMSGLFKRIVRAIKHTDSLLIVVSQTRSNIGNMFNPKTRSGGLALEFFSSHIMWLAIVGRIMKTKGRPPIGVDVRVRSSKSKLTGKMREVQFPIYNSYGIDDIGSCIDWLVYEDFWHKPQKAQLIDAVDIDMKASRAKLISEIESDPALRNQLREIMQKSWNTVEDELRVQRKSKYD